MVKTVQLWNILVSYLKVDYDRLERKRLMSVINIDTSLLLDLIYSSTTIIESFPTTEIITHCATIYLKSTSNITLDIENNLLHQT